LPQTVPPQWVESLPRSQGKAPPLRTCAIAAVVRVGSRSIESQWPPIFLPLEHHQPDGLSRSASSKRIIVASLEHRVQLPPPDAHIAAVEDRQRECILQQTSERSLMIIAVDTDNPHE